MESTVLIYGTSLAGYRLAYALGKMGYKSIILNRGSYVDQYKNQVLSQLPLDFCWICGAMPQRLFIGLGALQVFYNAEILEVSGEPGNFKVKVKKKDQYVNNLACTECEACIEACPVEVTENGEKRKAIYVIPKIGWENIFMIDDEHCTKCGECEKVCPTGCLKIDRPEEILEINVGAIVLAPEFEEPSQKDLAQFGYGKLANVVKSCDLARKSLLTNFIKNSLKRPSDGKLPEKIAIVVTPQYNQGMEYEPYNCSISAIYRACKIKELLSEAEVSVFLREFKGVGKGHYRWYKKALDKGINIVRAESLEIEDAPKENLTVKYALGGQKKELEAELVILITGQKPPTLMERLSEITGIEAESHGFCKILPFTCAKTTQEGIFAVGEFTGPKGNPETIWEGYAGAIEVLNYLASPNFSPPSPPPLRDVRGEAPKIGVFICSCFSKFNNYIDLNALVEKVKCLSGVTHVEIIDACCTPPTIKETAEKIKASGVNRVVLAVCTPLQKLLKFRKTVMMAGLNPLLAEFLRLREDVIRVHQDKETMLEKALALIASGIEKVKRAEAAPPPVDTFDGSALVIGGGVAGMEAALNLARRNFAVTLVEKTDKLGGLVRSIKQDLEGNDISDYVNKLIKEVKENPNITVYLKAEINDIYGYAGHYYAEIKDGENNLHSIQAGIIMLATGAKWFEPKGMFLYGEDARVLTQRELEEKLEKGEVSAKKVVMIQCVGSRDEKHPYCSRICCAQALKNALALREKGIEVTILYRDLTLYGFKEDYYKQALERGIKFIRFNEKRYPEVKISNNQLEVEVENLSLNPELVVLSVGIVPDENNRKLAELLDYKLDKDGFFDTDTNAYPYEEAIKRIMKPFELSTNGIFPVGLVHSPRDLSGTILTAKDAVGKALTVLPKKKLPAPNAMFVSAVKESKCVGCGICVEVCPYNAREIDEEKGIAKVRPFLCDACGACIVACPSEAAYLRSARGEMMIGSIDALLR